MASMESSIALIAAPFRFLLDALKVTLFVLSFPLLCGMVVLSYAVPDFDPLYRYLGFMQAHNIPSVVYPFAILGALLMLALRMLLIIGRDLGGFADAMFRFAPLFGITLFALASTFWFIVIRGVYRRTDGKKAGGWSSLFIGFTVAFIAGMYVSGYRDSMNPASLVSITILTVFSPTLIYLVFRALKGEARENTLTEWETAWEKDCTAEERQRNA